jgi:hypothetical protein
MRKTREQREAHSRKSAATRLANMMPGRRRTGGAGAKRTHNYASHSTRPDAPYARLMAESEAATAAHLARFDALPDSALPRPFERTIIEHRGTGERRVYPVSPIGQAIMSRADTGAGAEVAAMATVPRNMAGSPATWCQGIVPRAAVQ